MQYWYLICIGLEPVVCQATVIPPPGVPSIYTERLFVVYYSPALVEVLISTTDDWVIVLAHICSIGARCPREAQIVTDERVSRMHGAIGYLMIYKLVLRLYT